MTQPATAAEHANFLHVLADKLDPRKPQVLLTAADFGPGADTLREIAAHLERIASGGDADPTAEIAARIE